MWGDERGQEGSGLLHAVVSVWLQCILLAWRPGQWLSDHRIFPEKPPPLPQMCSSCPRSLCWGPGGRNYTGDDPVLLGLPAFQVGLTFVGWLWSYPPPSVATTELIPLMSSYADHHVATIHTLSLQKLEALCWIWCKGEMQHSGWYSCIIRWAVQFENEVEQWIYCDNIVVYWRETHKYNISYKGCIYEYWRVKWRTEKRVKTINKKINNTI